MGSFLPAGDLMARGSVGLGDDWEVRGGMWSLSLGGLGVEDIELGGEDEGGDEDDNVDDDDDVADDCLYGALR